MQRVLEGCRDDALAKRVAKAVVLLEHVAEQQPVTADLVSQCLYDTLDCGELLTAVRAILERLQAESLLSYSEKRGYKLQSSAGREWERERADIRTTWEQRTQHVCEELKTLLAEPERPRLHGVPFPWAAWYAEDAAGDGGRLQDPRTDASFAVDLRLVARPDQDREAWVRRSDERSLRTRLVWVAGDRRPIFDVARELSRSSGMISRYQPRRVSLSPEKRRLLGEEEGRELELRKKLRRSVAAGFTAGTMFFRGRAFAPGDLGGSFAVSLKVAAERVITEVFEAHVSYTVTEASTAQLLEKDLSGASSEFFEGGIGLLTSDGGRKTASCAGRIPTAVFCEIEKAGGLAGAGLFKYFEGPPFGWSPTLVRAC